MTTLSGWMLDRHHDAYSKSANDATRLAIALGAARSVIRVIDRSLPPMSVDWAATDMSATDFDRSAIVLNPKPILDRDPDAIDIVTAFGMHEASHSQESRSRYKHLLADGKPLFEPLRVAAWLWNVVEDVRIEDATSANWPGFRRYFNRLLDWLWENHQPDIRAKYGKDLKNSLAVVFLACRFPGRVTYQIGSVEEAEAAWWGAWQAAYLSGEADTPTTIQRALDHLNESEPLREKMQTLAEGERAERELGEQLRRQLDRLIREGVGGAPSPCAPDSEGIEILRLDPITSGAVREMVNEKINESKVVITASGTANTVVRNRRPMETAASRDRYVGPPSSEIAALRDALVFRASAPESVEKLLDEGLIDDQEIHRWAMGDMRIFSQKTVESKPEVLMGLLVDMSGSMIGRKLTIAQRLAQVFVWALHDQEGIETRVWGHTADVTDSAAEVFTIWEPGDPLSRLGLIDTLPHANNADGHAIAWCAQRMVDREQPEKVLVVLSDGLPSATGYGQRGAFAHIRSVCHWAASRGVRVIQVAIDPHGLRPEDQTAMFGDSWVGFTDYASLPRKVADLLARWA